MRAKTAVVLLFFAVLPVAPATAGELFRSGPVVCATASPRVTAFSVGRCTWQKAPGGGFYAGTCDGRAAIDGEEIQFSVSGQAKRVDHVFPDNDTPLTFDYRGLTCAVESRRLKTVQNCHAPAKGIGKECQVCAVTAAKVCFNVRVDVAIKKVMAAAPSAKKKSPEVAAEASDSQ